MRHLLGAAKPEQMGSGVDLDTEKAGFRDRSWFLAANTAIT